MTHKLDVACILCRRAEETEKTGALSSKDGVTAHHKCLSFASALYCRERPEYDDLFGFLVQDVLGEVQRGQKLLCHRCKRKGATAGCEVRRCKRSYHYPCAVEEGARTVVDSRQGLYSLYCSEHRQTHQRNSGAASDRDSPVTGEAGPSKHAGGAAPSKRYCVACEKDKGNPSLLYCDKHRRDIADDSTAAEPSADSSRFSSAGSLRRSSTKRQLSFTDEQETWSSERKRKIQIMEDSSDSEKDDSDEVAMFAPLESDPDENTESAPEQQHVRKDTEPLLESSPADQQMHNGSDKSGDEAVTLSDAESDSLLGPVTKTRQVRVVLLKEKLTRAEGSSPRQSPSMGLKSPQGPGEQSSGLSDPQQSCTRPPRSPDDPKPCTANGSRPDTSAAVSDATSAPSPGCQPSPAPSDARPDIDSARFWQSCNAAGCAQAIIQDHITEMSEISRKIQTDQASQEDYDLALKVMAASGRLLEVVSKQQKELEARQKELANASSIMKMVVSGLRRGVHHCTSPEQI